MGTVKSRPTAVVPGPSATTAALATRKSALRVRLWSSITVPTFRGKRFTREQRHLLKKYLPSLPISEMSTPADLTTATRHWGDVYKEGTTSATSKRSQGSWGRETKSQTTPLRELYDVFYAYLEEHSPELMPVFRASLQVRGKVLAHISAGMRSILASPDIPSTIVRLTQTHRRVGVQLEHFDRLAVALFHAMAQTSGERWTPDVQNAWRRLFVHCTAMLLVEQKKAQSQALKMSKSAKSSKSTSHLVTAWTNE